MGLWLRILVAGLVAGLTASFASPAMAAFPGVNGQIAFSTDRDGDYEIFSMNGDGTDQTNLSNNPATDSSPSISPDGLRITFMSDRDDPPEVRPVGVADIGDGPYGGAVPVARR